MRLHAIRVEHVRGLPAAEVRFADGVTVVEAPNEAGKSTLFDAFDLLLKEKHTSTKQSLKDLQPAGRDVGSVVEAELSVGDVHLTIRKCFNRDRSTELRVHAPSARQLTGNDAHDELRRILATGTDLALFEALRFRQGRGLDSLALSDSEHLARQLDASAGGTGEIGDDALYDRIVAQFDRYHTPTGQPGKVLREADGALEEVEEEVARLTATATELADAGARATELAGERRRLEEAISRLGPELAAHREHVRDLTALRGSLQTAESGVVAARAQAASAASRRADRERLIETIETIGRRLAQREQRAEAATAALRTQQVRLDALTATLGHAVTAEEAARETLRTARSAADLASRRGELRELRQRHGRIEDALEAAGAADAYLGDHPLTAAQLDAIRDASDRLRLAEARLDEAAPTFTLTPAQDLTRDLALQVDDEPHRQPAGAALVRSVPERLLVRIDGVADIEVRAGSSLAERQAECDQLRRLLAQACDEVGVGDRAGADELARTREDHRRALDVRDEAVARELDGMTRDELDDRIRRLETQVQELEAVLTSTDPTHPQLALVTDAAAERLPALERAERAAQETSNAARNEHDALVPEVARLRDAATVATTSVEIDREELDAGERNLASARDEVTDDELRAACDAADVEERAAVARRDALEDELARLRPDEIELLATNAEERHERSIRELQQVNEQAASVRAKIEVRGGEGVGEALQAAESERARRCEARRSLQARAAAAEALKLAFEQAREAAYAAYREPLRQRIVQAGRLVFGDDLDVELDESLAVVSRTLKGVTLAFDRLSAGAREQIAILTALAAADLAGDDGVPLVLDDTLGYTDADRLEKLGAVLGRVRGPQVIVLTCLGSRFQAVGGATVVRLRDVTGPG